ncbi:16S rRNA (guanine(966)-N(2))-methyltransferase RsmD [Pelagibacteraceae bacterium]|jgi:16S rRNA (guanine966-N2)-methyltransferase|nr:16S rRNA (guanine(966)-N(2))-methyltransferase RsmD [Pelagibacteraceae bacterium]
MRIIAGKFKGMTLSETTGNNTRPLKDMVKESIFNFLNHSNKIFFQFENSSILDLYSGTGSFGLECLSRNAKIVFFVERENEAIKILEKNIEKLNVKNISKIYYNDIFDIMEKNNKLYTSSIHNYKFDIIFCDPPFNDVNIIRLIKLIIEKKILNKDGILIFHRHKDSKEDIANYLKVIDERIYGVSKIFFTQINDYPS